MWRDFRPENKSVVLTNIENAANCAVAIHDNKIMARLNLATPLKIENGLYDFYYEANAQKFPADLVQLLKQSGIHLSVIYNLSLMKTSDRGKRTDTLTLQEYLDVYAHESFHLQTAVPFDFKLPFGTPWPSWANQPDRWKVSPLCYLSPQARPYLNKEKEIAINLMQQMFVKNDIQGALLLARQFVAARNARYSALSNIRVPSTFEPAGITCEKAEAIMEMVEGVAQYVGVGTMWTVGIYSIKDVLEYLKPEPDSWFYNAGMVQMLVINKLSGHKIRAITSRLSQSKSWDSGVSYEFQKAIGLITDFTLEKH